MPLAITSLGAGSRKPAQEAVGPRLCGNSKGGVNAGDAGAERAFWISDTTVDGARFPLLPPEDLPVRHRCTSCRKCGYGRPFGSQSGLMTLKIWQDVPENLLLYWPIVPEKRHFHQESVGIGAAAERPGTREEGSQRQGVRFLRHFPHGRPGAGCGRCRWRGGDRRLLKDVPILAPSGRREPLRVQPGQSEAGNGLGPAPTSWKRPGRTGPGHRLDPATDWTRQSNGNTRHPLVHSSPVPNGKARAGHREPGPARSLRER